jgi:protein Tex
VQFRDRNGAFKSRKNLLDVERLGPKAYEQAAGFLRIMNGLDPLDASAVHPEAYPVVQSIVKSTAVAVNDIVGNSNVLKSLKASDFVTEQFGLPTITDIINELHKPGRDPRPEFKTANFNEDVHELSDLKIGMILEGVVSNVANFGAFVDVGVHQDGLVHISAMTDKFISDPREIVKAGDIVKVKVMEVDVARKRVSFTMRLNDTTPVSAPSSQSKENTKKPMHNKASTQQKAQTTANPLMGNAFAEAFAKAKKR